MRNQLQRIAKRASAVGVLLAAATLVNPAYALDPATRLRDYNHTTWTEREGAPRHIENMVQTADGWIWISAVEGLFRFDGTHFEAVTLPRQNEPWRKRVANLYAAPNGDLWINFSVAANLAILHPDGRLDDVATIGTDYKTTSMFAAAPDGAIWAATSRGPRRYRGTQEVAAGPLTGLPAGAVYSLLFEPDGRMWVTHEQGVFMRAADDGRFERVTGTKGETSLIRAPDGGIWLASRSGDSVQLLASPSPRPHARDADPVQAQSFALFDGNGNLWSTSCAQRLCVTPGAATREPLPLHPTVLAAAGKAGVLPALPPPVLVMEDGEGSLWVATDSTVERLRDSRLRPSPVPIALGGSMGIDDTGQVWVVDREAATAWRMAAAGATADRSQPFQLVTDDIDNRMLLAGRREIERRWKGRVERIPLPPGADGRRTNMDVLGVQDDGKVVWTYTLQTGLIGYVDGQWHPHDFFNLPKDIMLTTPGGAGRLWLACLDGGIFLYDNGKLTRHDGSAIGGATVMLMSDNLTVAGNLGIGVLKGRRVVRLQASDPDVLRDVSGIVVDADGDRWLNGAKGVVHVHAADWRASVADPTLPLRLELFNAADGYTGRAYLDNRLPTAMADKDRQLWVATTDGVLHMDMRARRRAAAPPRVAITAFNRDGVEQPAHNGASLSVPAAPRNVSINYAAPGMGRPEAVRFAYRLAGEDSDWQDVGTRRTAFFTALSPGLHRFEVRAANQDGVWSTAPATLELTVAPTLSQTAWFRTLLCLLALTVLWLLYRLRLRTVSMQIRARMHERLDERNRIARELHDTLLQSVQALLFKVQGAAMRLPATEPVKPMLEAALHQAELAVDEGRTRVRDLRGDDEGDMPLAEMLAAVGHELSMRAGETPRTGTGSAFAIHLHGAVRALAGGVHRELFAIGREALINAFRHAAAEHIEVILDFGKRDFMLTIVDDGVGIPSDFIGTRGRAGHWGIGGMRERAATMGAQLRIAPGAGRGTTVSIRLPAAQAYADRRIPFLKRWRA